MIDLAGRLFEARMIVEEVPIVCEVVDVNFEAFRFDSRQGLLCDGVPGSGDQLKRSRNLERSIHRHELWNERQSGRGLDIMRHDGATRMAFGPEPDEWDPPARHGLKRKHHE